MSVDLHTAGGSVTTDCSSGDESQVSPEDVLAPDLTLDDISNGRLARIVEETRMRRILFLQARDASRDLELDCLKSQVRNEMQRDGVLSHKIPGVGKFTLLPPRAKRQCDDCAKSIGDGMRDRWLSVEAA